MPAEAPPVCEEPGSGAGVRPRDVDRLGLASVPPGEDVVDADTTAGARQLTHGLEGLGLEWHSAHLVVLGELQQDGATVELLPDVSQTIDWVRLPNRFPVRVQVTGQPPIALRIGQTASVSVAQ